MKHHITGNGWPMSDHDMIVETCGQTVEVVTFGVRGGIKGFIVLNRDEFQNLLEELSEDETLKKDSD